MSVTLAEVVSYSDFLRQYLTIAIFGLLGVGMAAFMLGLGRVLRPVRPQEQKYITYESGVDPVGVGWSQTQIRYYIFALLFVLFDVETVFVFAWALRVETYEYYGLGVMTAFIVILGLPLIYAWRKRVLQWV
jgi:NADH-quinone oxidoreductase subunit A